MIKVINKLKQITKHKAVFLLIHSNILKLAHHFIMINVEPKE